MCRNLPRGRRNPDAALRHPDLEPLDRDAQNTKLHMRHRADLCLPIQQKITNPTPARPDGWRPEIQCLALRIACKIRAAWGPITE